MPAHRLADIADRLLSYCRAGEEAKALDELYAEDAVSVEAAAQPGAGAAETRGLDGIRGKHAWWAEAMVVHDFSAEGPFFHGEDRFGAIFTAEMIEKATGARSAMRESAIYTVAGGKIVREEFFYDM